MNKAKLKDKYSNKVFDMEMKEVANDMKWALLLMDEDLADVLENYRLLCLCEAGVDICPPAFNIDLVGACERIRREASDLVDHHYEQIGKHQICIPNPGKIRDPSKEPLKVSDQDFWNSELFSAGSAKPFTHVGQEDHILEFKGTLDVNKGEGIGEIIKKNSAVNHPSHYGGDTVYETIKVIHAWGLGFDLGNAVKYISRAGKKDQKKLIEDLEKAIFYINAEIAELKKKDPGFAKAE